MCHILGCQFMSIGWKINRSYGDSNFLLQRVKTIIILGLEILGSLGLRSCQHTLSTITLVNFPVIWLNADWMIGIWFT